MTEFEMIETYFRPLTRGNSGAAGLRDDAAVIEIPQGTELVVTSDTLNEGVHFWIGEDPAHIARKALRVNLSDLASMGADPLCYQLNLAFASKPDHAWLSAFTKALGEDNAEFGIYCSGGDTTQIKGDYLSISITAMGTVPRGQAVRRGGAKDGDLIVLTGAVGDALLGLRVLQGGLDLDMFPHAVERYRVPRPRLCIAQAIRRYAHAAADISDGMLADCMHIATASGLGAEIDLSAVHFSKEVQNAIEKKVITQEEALTGGDDYELVLAVPPENLKKLTDLMGNFDLNHIVIGVFRGKISGFDFYNVGSYRIDDKTLGWKHF